MVSSTTGNAKFDADIKDAVLTWKWKAIAVTTGAKLGTTEHLKEIKGFNTIVTIPFNFAE
jgi:hypothetical protein